MGNLGLVPACAHAHAKRRKETRQEVGWFREWLSQGPQSSDGQSYGCPRAETSPAQAACPALPCRYTWCGCENRKTEVQLCTHLGCPAWMLKGSLRARLGEAWVQEQWGQGGCCSILEALGLQQGGSIWIGWGQETATASRAGKEPEGDPHWPSSPLTLLPLNSQGRAL